MPVVATPTPGLSAINATSGDTVAAAGQAQSNLSNAQLSAGTAGGGNGSLAVTNQHSSSVVDTSAASAQSGLSVALAPTVLPGTPVPAGITTASSGNTAATGLMAQNNVSNTAAGLVQVAGANNASVSLNSSSSVDVRDTAASGAASGQAWAVAAGASGSPQGVATPDTAGSPPNTAAAASMGLTARNNLSSTVTATLTTTGGPAGAHPLSLGDSQSANIGVVAVAAATSAPACAGGTCTPGSTTALTAPGAQASSGPASAQGLTAQNTVNTTSNVAIRVGGKNFSPIQVIVDSITHILNLGVASATSGDTTAGWSGSGAGGAAAQTASSGNAQASGGRVQNTVTLGASESVHVTGDNYNPISVIMNLTANLVNWGVGLARSGDAQSTGTGGGAARSGAADANGLQVMNVVNMWADASVNVDGNNYAPIFVHITFTTNIDNRGVAEASSGNVAAGPAATAGSGSALSAAKSTAGAGSGTSRGSVGSSVKAQSGNALAVSNAVVANITSDQLSSANGSKPITSQTVAQMLHNLPSGTWDPFIQQRLLNDATPVAQNGLSSRTGDAVGTGLQSEVNITNSQLVACKDPTVVCVAQNAANLSVVSQDSKTNPATIDPSTGGPGPGGVRVQVSDALANATPTPTPLPGSGTSVKPGASSDEGSSGSGSRSASSRARSASPDSATRHVPNLPANGHYVVVDLWDKWPGRRLPPMPNAQTHQPSVTSVSASLDNWPGADELPLPDLSAETASPPAASSQAPRRLSSRRAADSAAGDNEDLPMLQVVQVDPWGTGPDLEALPVPGQALPVARVAQPDTIAAAAPIVEPEEPGASPVEFGLAALLSVLGGLVGLRRGRFLSALLRVHTLRARAWSLPSIPAPRWPKSPVVPAGFSRHTQRALAMVRLTLGILRVW